MIRSSILRASIFLLPFKMFLSQQTLAISFFSLVEKNSWYWFDSQFETFYSPLSMKLDVRNGYEHFRAAEHWCCQGFPSFASATREAALSPSRAVIVHEAEGKMEASSRWGWASTCRDWEGQLGGQLWKRLVTVATTRVVSFLTLTMLHFG